MSCAFELHFDEATEAIIRMLWDAAAQLGHETARNGVAPHVTLAIAADYDPAIEPELRRFAGDHPPFGVAFRGIETFPTGVEFLSPILSPGLEAVHAEFHRRFPSLPAASNSHYYLPGQWVPHCTIATFQSDSWGGAEVEFDEPLRGRFTRLRVVEYPSLVMRFECALG